MKVERITSRDNEKLKLARRVRDGKERDLIFIEGSRLCGEAVSSNIDLETIFVTERFMETESFGAIADKLQSVYVVSESLFESTADTNSPQGIVIIGRRPAFKSTQIDGSGPSLFLYQINNPLNLGAVIRTAEAASVSKVLISAGSSDPYSPKALRASMGSAFRTHIAEGCVLENAIDKSKKNGIEVLAIDKKGKSIYSMDVGHQPQMLVFGSEADGLPDEVLEAVHSVVSIPMSSRVESLNLAVSCGIILFEMRRQSQQDQ